MMLGTSELQARSLVRDMLSQAGWSIEEDRRAEASGSAGLYIRRGTVDGVVRIKWLHEGRGDRVISAWAQACLESMTAADGERLPIAIVVAPRISPRSAQHVLAFAAEHATNVGAGVVDLEGMQRFRGAHIDDLNAETVSGPPASPSRSPSVDLFTDRNQWMLKILLAPELPDTLTGAPRGRYRNASELAESADVSVMSAFRLVRQLERDGFLHESAGRLTLVRRGELFHRWKAWAVVKQPTEIPMRFLFPSDVRMGLRTLFEEAAACIGLFSAADALGVGFVDGVPPHVYVRRLEADLVGQLTNAVPAERHEPPDFILRKAPTPESIFRGAVRRHDLLVTDIIQVWLDVSANPARGVEQADHIWRRVLKPLIDG